MCDVNMLLLSPKKKREKKRRKKKDSLLRICMRREVENANIKDFKNRVDRK
jgi:hypothetical protein